MKGLGNDIIEIERVKSAHQDHGKALLDRLFTEREQSYCLSCKNPYPRLAGRFAAKEAVVKALGLGFGAEVSWKDIEILPDEKGKPVVTLSGSIKERHANSQIFVSISHSKDYASAVAAIF